jgi:putative transposase
VAEKKVRTAGLSREELRSWIDKDGIDTSGEQRLSIVRQCELLGLSRSTWYYRPCGETSENLALMKQIDREYTRTPFYGSRKLAKVLGVNRKRVQRLMRTMGIEAIGPKRRTTRPAAGHKVYPYLLRDVEISRPDQVWSTDITYIPLRHGFLYLVAVLDWFSRYVLSWRLSNTLEGSFCVEALEEALAKGSPEIFNSDQGSQFTSPKFTGPLLARGIAISMDGRGRALDNVFIERLWRTVKWEEVYAKDYADGWEAQEQLGRYFRFYCEERIHQSLGYRTPASVYGRCREGGDRKNRRVPPVKVSSR